MDPLSFHLLIEAPKNTQKVPQTSSEWRAYCEAEGSVLFVQLLKESQDTQSWIIQMRYPIDALNLLDNLSCYVYDKVKASIQYQKKIPIWIGNLPAKEEKSTSALRGGKCIRAKINEQTLSEVTIQNLSSFLVNFLEEKKVTPLGVYVHPHYYTNSLPWGMVYVTEGQETSILVLNNTIPSQEENAQPLRINIWKNKSQAGIKGLRLYQSKLHRKRFMKFEFCPLGKNLIKFSPTFPYSPQKRRPLNVTQILKRHVQ